MKTYKPSMLIRATSKIKELIAVYKKSNARLKKAKGEQDEAMKAITKILGKKLAIENQQNLIVATYDYNKSTVVTDWEAVAQHLADKLDVELTDKFLKKFSHTKTGYRRFLVK